MENKEPVHNNREPDDNLTLSIVIPSFKDRDKIVICLDSLKRNLGDLSYEVIVIENGSGEDTADVIERDFPWVKVIRNEKNRFFSGANNQGMEASKGRYVLFLNSDTEVFGDVIQKMINYMEKKENSRVGMCNCNVYLPDGSIQDTEMHYIGPKEFLARLFVGRNYIRKFGRFDDYLDSLLFVRDNHTEEAEVENVVGVILLVRGDLIRELKGFDDRYKLYYTDNELCIRIRKRGYSIVSLPYDKILHHHSVATKRLPKVNRILEEDTALYLKDKLGFWAYLFLFPLYVFERRIMAWYLKRKFSKLSEETGG